MARVEYVPSPLTVGLQDGLKPVIVKPELEVLHPLLFPQFVRFTSVPRYHKYIYKPKALVCVHLDRSAFVQNEFRQNPANYRYGKCSVGYLTGGVGGYYAHKLVTRFA